MNHIWLRHFGAPLVENVFDFGAAQPAAMHAELLDWLAVELVEHDWSMKHLHRLMVTSAPIAWHPLGAMPDEANLKIDPDNRYLWQMNTRRLEAELVRDCLLYRRRQLGSVARRPGHRSAARRVVPAAERLFPPRLRKADAVPGRSSMPPTSMNATAARESVIPQQALAVANSPLSLSQSRLLARQLAEYPTGGTATTAILFKPLSSAFCRALPSADERHAGEKFLADQATRLAEPETLTAFAGEAKAEVSPSSDPRLSGPARTSSTSCSTTTTL